MKDRIFLIGYMGSGKSSVGKELASLLGWKYIDLDASIEFITGKTISQIFKQEGESNFRKIERETLLELATKKNIVVATGGGCPTYLDNMEWMNRNGLTVYLKTHPGTLFHRSAQDKSNRPLIADLADVDLIEFILSSLKKRLLFYIKSIITVSGEGIPAVTAQKIVASMK